MALTIDDYQNSMHDQGTQTTGTNYKKVSLDLECGTSEEKIETCQNKEEMVSKHEIIDGLIIVSASFA